MTEKFKPESGPKPEKEPFKGEIRIEPGMIGQDKWTADKKLIVTKLVIDAEGKIKVQKGTYDMTRVPKSVDDAEFGAAEFYDKNPKIETLDIEPDKADDILARMQADLEARIKETKAELETEEDQERHYVVEGELYGHMMPDLDKLKSAREALKK